MNENNNKTSLQKEEENLIKKYQILEKELKNVETVIDCQTKKSEIIERKKEIVQQLFSIRGILLEESEEFKEQREREEEQRKMEVIKKIVKNN